MTPTWDEDKTMQLLSQLEGDYKKNYDLRLMRGYKCYE